MNRRTFLKLAGVSLFYFGECISGHESSSMPFRIPYETKVIGKKGLIDQDLRICIPHRYREIAQVNGFWLCCDSFNVDVYDENFRRVERIKNAVIPHDAYIPGTIKKGLKKFLYEPGADASSAFFPDPIFAGDDRYLVILGTQLKTDSPSHDLYDRETGEKIFAGCDRVELCSGRIFRKCGNMIEVLNQDLKIVEIFEGTDFSTGATYIEIRNERKVSIYLSENLGFVRNGTHARFGGDCLYTEARSKSYFGRQPSVCNEISFDVGLVLGSEIIVTEKHHNGRVGWLNQFDQEFFLDLPKECYQWDLACPVDGRTVLHTTDNTPHLVDFKTGQIIVTDFRNAYLSGSYGPLWEVYDLESGCSKCLLDANLKVVWRDT